MDTVQTSIFDICAGRHGGNEQSQAAFRSASRTSAESRAAVLAFIRSCGAHGATNKEIAAHFGKGINAVSGRRSELLADGSIVETDRRRDGCGVVVAPEFAEVAA